MTDTNSPTLAQRIGAHFGDKIVGVTHAYGETTVEVLPETWLAVAQQLRDLDDSISSS
jgi:NADH-quinone oxidoreductase subunit C